MKNVLHWMRARKKALVLFLLCALVLWLLFRLYRLPMEPFWYGMALCLLAGIGIGVYDGVHYFRKCRQIAALRQVLIDQTDLPMADHLLEEEYRELLLLYRQEIRRIQAERDQASQAESDYYTLWAHQIKTPISAMHLLLQSGAEPKELRSELFQIEEYVEMALHYLRLESIHSDFRFAPCDLDTLIRQAVKKYAGQFIHKRIRLVYEPVCCRVLADEKWLSFVLEQVLSNALKYTPAGSITIRMEAGMPDVLCIEDTGIGISPEDLPRVFQRGFTGYNGRTHRKSTGIGLYLCKRIMDQMGFRMEARSRVGEGTGILLFLHNPRSAADQRE